MSFQEENSLLFIYSLVIDFLVRNKRLSFICVCVCGRPYVSDGNAASAASEEWGGFQCMCGLNVNCNCKKARRWMELWEMYGICRKIGGWSECFEDMFASFADLVFLFRGCNIYLIQLRIVEKNWLQIIVWCYQKEYFSFMYTESLLKTKKEHF